MKTAIITGPTGVLGMNLLEKLLFEGIKVYAVCRPNSTVSQSIPPHPLLTIITCDISNIMSIKEQITEKCDVFYDFAWLGTFGDTRNDMYLQNKNIEYTLDAVRLANDLGCEVFIGAGSQAEYGRADGILRADTPTFPENGYGMAKLCAGQMSRILCNQLNIKHIWIRILSLYGPYDGPYTMVMSTIGKLLSGEETAFTLGEQQWDYLYGADAANAFYLAALHGKNNKIYVLGSGKVKPLSAYIQEIGNIVSPKTNLGIGKVPYSEKQVMYLCADISELAKDTGFSPEIDFREGIGKTLKWFKK
ncbi:MAG: NAD-dependent epimerase/dehydratase family protein [Clostridiales bacterium]